MASEQPDKQSTRPETPEERKLRQPAPIDDCLPCRLTGALALCGLAGYALVKGQQQLIADKKQYPPWEYKFRRVGVAGIAMLLFSIGIGRAFH